MALPFLLFLTSCVYCARKAQAIKLWHFTSNGLKYSRCGEIGFCEMRVKRYCLKRGSLVIKNNV